MKRFDEVITMRAGAAGPGRAVLDGELDASWLQGKSAFGGLQGAFGLRGLRAVAGDALPLRALQVTFVAAIEPGPVHVEADLLRQGRAVTHAQCRLVGGGQVAALMVGLFGATRASKATLPLAPPADAKPLDSLREAPFLPELMPGFLQHYRQRWAEGALPYSASPPRRTRMWAQLREPPARPDPLFNEANAVALTDLPPTPVLSMLERRAPGASLTWLLEFLVDPRELDPTGWLLLQTEARAAGEGYATQTALIWDEAGRGVAVSHQTVAVFG